MRLTCVVVLAVSGCVDLQLPPIPGPPQPGTLTGRVLTAQPGRTAREPVQGVEVLLLGSSAISFTDASGSFSLTGITTRVGRVLFRFDGDADGAFEKQKLMTLQALEAGPGRNISLGDVLLGDNARLEGKVLRGDVAATRGHAGTLAFIPEGPFSALSADDGSFAFDQLPEGSVALSFFRVGYRGRDVGEVQLTSGQSMTMREVRLVPLESTAMPLMLQLSGRVVSLPASSISAARVQVSSEGMAVRTVSVAESGEFTVTLPEGLYALRVSLDGYREAIVSNVALIGAARDVGSIVLVSGTGVVGGPGAAGGTAGGGAAGGGTAGGGAAGGGAAGGGSAGGGATAGGATAGGATTAGGAAGGATAGGAIAGGATAGGTAGGASTSGGAPLPIAIVDARTFVRVGSSGQLDGRRSIDPGDAGPLSFRWTEQSDAGLALSSNDSVLAAVPTFTAPAQPRTLAYGLVVTNRIGLSSVPVTTIVEVLAPPVVNVAPSMIVMRPLTTATVSAAASTDPTAAPLSFAWSVVSGTVVLSSGSGPSVTVTAPAMPEGASLRLIVSNPGVSADAVIIPVVVSATATPTATVTVSPPRVVGPSDAVTITAAASSTNAAEGFSFAWTQSSGTPVAFTGSTTSTLGFTAPAAVGRLSFTVTATGDAGATGVAVATIDVEDDDAPVLVTSDPLDAPGASGGWYSLTATFNEALDPTSVNSTNVQLRAGTTNVPAELALEANAQRVRVTPLVPLVPGASYTLVLGALTDLTPRRNAFAGRSLAFNARPPRYTSWSRAMAFTNATTHALPGLAVTSTNVWLVSRDTTGGSAPAGVVFDVNLADGGSTLTFLPGGNANLLPTRRGFVVNDVPFLFAPNGPATYFRVAGSTWARVPTNGSEVGLASDGQRLVGFYENYGPHWLSFTSTTSAPNDEHVDNFMGMSWATLNSSTGYELFSGAVSGPAQFLVVPSTVSGQTARRLRAYFRPAPGAWQNLTSVEALPLEPRELRTTIVGGVPVACYVHIPSSGRQLSCSAWNGTGWNHLSDIAPGAVDDLDLFTRHELTWLSYAAGGRIFVKSVRTVPGLTASTLVGPTGNSEWVLNPACSASNPESFATSTALYVAWEDAACSSNGNQIVRIVRVE